MKKRELQAWKKATKKTKIVVNKKILELKEDRCLFARLMMVCQSRPEINLQEGIGTYEFSLMPRSLFVADGEMLHCLRKRHQQSIQVMCCQTWEYERKWSLSMEWQSYTHSINQLSWQCVLILLNIYRNGSPEVIWKWWITPGLWQIWLSSFPEICYSSKKARRSTSSLLPCNRLHSHRQGTHKMFVLLGWTKMELTEYLTAKVIQRWECMGKNVIVAWGCYCQGTHFDVTHLRSSQEHRTKCQESADWNVAETHDVAETQRLTCVSGSGYMSFIHVSVAAVMTEPDHFFYVSASVFSW